MGAASIASTSSAGAGEYRHHRHYRDYARGEVVDAPYARVEAGRRVVVDTPFAHVYSGPDGQHVVAPFVDLWVPRADD